MQRKMTDFELLILEKAEVTCSDVEKLLLDYVETDMPQTLHGRIKSHIEECEECQELEAGYRLTIQLAKELRHKPMPSDARRRFREGLNQKLGLSLSIE